MTEDSRSLSDLEIVEMFNAGKLTAHVFSYRNFSDKESAYASYSRLHNDGKIDLLSLTQGSEFDSVSQNSFFAGQHFFCEVIPTLQASTNEMMLCVNQLVKKAGEDLAAGQPNAAFRTWCSLEQARAKEVIALARAGDSIASEFLTFALEAGRYFDESLEIFRTYSDSRRLSAITAISRMQLNADEIEIALDAFQSVLKNNRDDVLFANMLSSAFNLMAGSEYASPKLTKLARVVCQSPGPQVHFCCARIIWMHTKLLTDELLSILADALKSVDPTHKRTLHELDIGLSHLLRTPLIERGVELLGVLLAKHPQEIAISNFESFGHELLKVDNVFHKLIVSWLLSGDRPLCDALSRLLNLDLDQDRAITLAPDNLKLAPAEQIFLCRKAIGYFFNHPVFAGSVLVSVLRVASDDVSKQVAYLLFDPLLRNYGGKLKDHLSELSSQDRAWKWVKSALDEADQYLSTISAIPEISELAPSESERQAVHRRDADEVRESHKAAMKQSVFLSLIRRSVVLYGKRTLSYVQGPGDEQKFVEMDLKSHSFGWELPRTTIIDPVGLDFMLRIFRNERLRHEAHSS